MLLAAYMILEDFEDRCGPHDRVFSIVVSFGDGENERGDVEREEGERLAFGREFGCDVHVLCLLCCIPV